MKKSPRSICVPMFLASTALAMFLPHSVLAQAATDRAEQGREFDIPPQSLHVALRTFAELTGVQLVYSSALVNGLESARLKGNYRVNDALQLLLSGTGLTFRVGEGNTVVIERPRGNDTRVLGPVRVEGAQPAALNGINGSRDVTATEGTGSFTTGAMTIGSKSPRSIKDTPQSVSVITSEQLEQQNITDFTQALRQAPGVSFAQGTTSLEMNFYSRGFAVNSIQIDGGAPLTTSFAESTEPAYFPQIDLSQYDHVEVLRGAAGLFNGYGNPSGTINLVRKKPLAHGQVTLDAEAGSWNNRRVVLDASAPLALDGRLRGRAVMTWQSNEYFYNIAEDEKTLIYGVLDYDLTPTTLITAGASRTSQDSTPWYFGLPRYQTGEDLRLPRETALIFPWNRHSIDTTEIFTSIEQQMGENWKTKLNLTHNDQSSKRKVGYSSGTVNPVDNRGPRIVGVYADFASDQLTAEATLSGAFTLFGQRQEVTLGVNRSDQDGGGLLSYASPISSSPNSPYQPYPGGPAYCFTTSTSSVCPAGTIASETPPIDVFAFDPFDRNYTEPRNPLPSQRHRKRGQVQSLAYANLRLTAFDRLHLETGVRWSRYEREMQNEGLCTNIPTSGTPTASNCVGRQIGDSYAPFNRTYRGDKLSWPPALAFTYDLTDSLGAYLGYTDIYQDQSRQLDGDLEPLDPVTGANVELGLKWGPRGGRLNAALSVYRIELEGFAQKELNFNDRYKRNPNGTFVRDANNQLIVIANDGTEMPDGRPDADHECCFFERDDQTQVSEGVDAEVSGEVLPGWQVSTSFTLNQTKFVGRSYGAFEGRPLLSIAPKRLYKLWTTYDFGAAGHGGWLSRLTFSGGVNGQSEGFKSGEVCVKMGPPRPDGTSLCLPGGLVPFEFEVEPYAVFSSRIGYKLGDRWSAALNVENLFDKTYYESVGNNPNNGHWYGAPRSFTLNLRGTF